jgi:5-methylcytosine-specific restriction endonuclease McrA
MKRSAVTGMLEYGYPDVHGDHRSSIMAATRRERDRARSIAGQVALTRKRRAVYARDGYRCVKCGSGDDLTLDHIRPVSWGGSNRAENLQTMCGPCNRAKGNEWDGVSGFPARLDVAVVK